VLQNGEYIKVGSSKVEKTDVRVVAATNVNLEYAVAQGKFRQDLYYRLSGFMIYMPPLRDRKEDISLLFRKFASDFSEKYGMKKVNLTNDATRLLISYRWPGNVRQLKSVAENVSVLETSGPVNPSSGRIEVNAEMLAKHLPKENPEDMLPAKVERPDSDAFSSSEKQAIVNAIVELKKDVELLKAQIKGNVQVPDVPTAVLNHLNDDADWQGQGMPVTKDDISKAPVIDIPVEPEEQMPQSSTIKELSNELMRQRLEANHGNRKLTAQQLGISERTLYRRLPPEYKNQRKPNK
jgi:transcriptional regulator with PAS, ATPase and Fis domain